ncbi:glycerophosphodiester phosphodiesterase family protein [Siphonobacter sp. SORGH_AS_0500]|uniref:glycerophosphodiester phosphodiesterase family protein n=1 Tax=Siphonobacter sp. SORGH_AS_0500 TaxID=1864824 RepID=UPI00285BB20F|nr:glycerophosphodiester phosphodiesterase family protein [Siphonobacter sp. SORGH_AS_0500]MDR6197666.1 glycerophosphoryl diester phosphodiesterase [Siphonobacter sp. SORGH_AS_0500]
MKRCLAVFTLLVFSLMTQAQSNFNTLQHYFNNPAIVLVASHRAVHHTLPENSIPAFQKAIEIGVDIIETDVKVSKDGIPFLLHDRTLNRTTNGRGNAEEYTLAELNTLYLKDSQGKLTSERIPTLEELLRLAKGKIYIDLDLKTDRLSPVVEMIRKMDMSAQVFFFDDDTTALAQVRQVNAADQLMPRAHSKTQAEELLSSFKPKLIHIDHSFYEAPVSELIKKQGARVWINALGEPDALVRKGQIEKGLSMVLDHGANVIQTDEPELLLKLLKERKLHP